jgi:hypothetical protein
VRKPVRKMAMAMTMAPAMATATAMAPATAITPEMAMATAMTMAMAMAMAMAVAGDDGKRQNWQSSCGKVDPDIVFLVHYFNITYFHVLNSNQCVSTCQLYRCPLSSTQHISTTDPVYSKCFLVTRNHARRRTRKALGKLRRQTSPRNLLQSLLAI